LLAVGEPLVNESISGSVFEGRIVVPTMVGDFNGVITEISGKGAITGFHQFVLDTEDAVQDGFRIR
jgi:proline racemase